MPSDARVVEEHVHRAVDGDGRGVDRSGVSQIRLDVAGDRPLGLFDVERDDLGRPETRKQFHRRGANA
jgi:hypothetical protein